MKHMNKKDELALELMITDLLVRVATLEKILVKLTFTTREELTSEASALTEQITSAIIEKMKADNPDLNKK